LSKNCQFEGVGADICLVLPMCRKICLTIAAALMQAYWSFAFNFV